MGGFKSHLNLRTPCSFVVDLEGNLLESNEAFGQLFHESPRNITDLLAYPEEWLRIRAYLQAGGVIEGWRLRLKNTKGPKWGELFASYDEAQKRIVGLLFDVSNRIKTEEALKKALVWHWVLLDAIPLAVIVADLKEGHLLTVNQAARMAFAFPSARIEKFHVSQLFDPPQEWDALKEKLSEKNKLIFSTRHRRFTGETFPAEDYARAFPYQDENKIILVVNDTSWRKETEKLLFLLFSALEHANESVIITDREGKIIYVNPAFEKASGYSFGEALGQKPSILKSGYHSSKFYQELWSTILSGQTWRGRIVNRRKDGRLYTEEVTIFPAREEFSEITHFVAIQRDVTREIEIENHLQQVAKLEAIAQLAGGIAHEFNNILTTISGYAELLLIKGKGMDQKSRDALQAIFSQAKRAAHLVNQLLDFSRRNKPEKTIFELGAFVEENRRLFEGVITEKIKLEIILPEKKLFVRGSPSQLKQVFFNLIINAKDAMPEGGKITFLVEESPLSFTPQPFGPEKKWVKIAISDTGHGISQDISSRIFEPFFTTKANGTGLGLAQVYGIVREHGGHIQVNSIPGQGTTFEIFLPLVEAKDSQQQVLFEDI